ncbi:MAG: hypothetical protein AAF598_02960 [Bacteroidota bacterium]
MKKLLLSLMSLVLLLSTIGAAELPGGDKNKKKKQYNGEFKNGKYHGEGTMKFPDGSVYTGAWEHGTQQGWGHFMWADGNEYEGYFKRGKMDGEGTFYWADGTDYHGSFKRGFMHGIGKLTMANGNVFEGQMENGFRNGPGKVTLSNGIIITGNYRDGVLEGFLEMTYLDDSKLIGELRNGTLINDQVQLVDAEQNTQALVFNSANEQVEVAEKLGWFNLTLAVQSINLGNVELAKEQLNTIKTNQHHNTLLDTLVQQQLTMICDHCE